MSRSPRRTTRARCGTSIDYLPTGTTIHRRIYVENDETRTARFTVYPDAAQISNELFTGDAGGAATS